jgi:hypothetical protein
MKDWRTGGREMRVLVQLKEGPIIDIAVLVRRPQIVDMLNAIPAVHIKAGICIRTCTERSAARINVQVDAGRTIYITYGRVVENGDRIV